ncbi:hypothetical protein [Mesorhizobium sp. M1338]
MKAAITVAKRGHQVTL